MTLNNNVYFFSGYENIMLFGNPQEKRQTFSQFGAEFVFK